MTDEQMKEMIEEIAQDMPDVMLPTDKGGVVIAGTSDLKVERLLMLAARLGVRYRDAQAAGDDSPVGWLTPLLLELVEAQVKIEVLSMLLFDPEDPSDVATVIKRREVGEA